MRSVGTYEVLRTLARGGMAELLLARAVGPHGFRKDVVLKRLHPHLADDPGFTLMFLDEARLAAQLDHPNVAQVFDIGEGDEGAFFAMEYLRGADVRALLAAEDGGLPLEHSIAIAIGAAAGLHHAHTKVGHDGDPLAVIHRDVSPTNVFVTYEGAVKVLDFGIAKATSNQRHTAHSRIKGKVAYMSPEQCAGAPLDARSDVFALGAVLYEMSTGRRPFEGDNEFAVMNAIVNRDVPSPAELRDGYPESLAEIVLRALARDPEDRFASADEMRGALEQVASECGLASSPAALGELIGSRVPIEAEDEDGAASPTPVQEVADPTRGSEPTIAVPPGGPPAAAPRWRRWTPAIVGVALLAVALAFGAADRGEAKPGISQDHNPARARGADAVAAPGKVEADGADVGGLARTQPRPEAAVAHPGPVAAPPAGAEPSATEPASPTQSTDPQSPPVETTPGETARDETTPDETTPDAEPPSPRSRKGRRPSRKRKAEAKPPAAPPTAVDGNGWVPIRKGEG